MVATDFERGQTSRFEALLNYRVELRGALSMTMFARFIKDESGATAIEYGLIASLIAIAIIAVLGTLGGNLSSKFNQVATELAKP